MMVTAIRWISLTVLLVTAPSASLAGDSIRVKADRLFADEKFLEAVEEYGKLEPSADVLKRIGASQIRLWDMPAALRSLRRAERLAPDDLSLKALIAEALGWEKEFDDATRIYRGIFGKGYDDEEARLGYARVLGWNREYQLAVDEYRVILAKDSASVEALMGLGLTLSWQKRFEEAIAAYRKVRDAATDEKLTSDALTRIAQITSWQGRFEEAVSLYREAGRSDPKNVDALFGLGEVSEWMGRYPEAKSCYEQILQIQTDHKAAKAKLLQLMWVK
jgi:tetratricopeptide (TPR) repeat protein